MTIFEYLAIAYSLIFSLAAVRLVAGLPHALDRTRTYAVHVAHVGLLLFAIAALFWSQWSARDVEWTFPKFLLQLAGPGTIYFLACTIVPDDPAAVQSWQQYFFSIRRRYFAGLCVWALVLAVNATVFTGLPFLHPIRGVQLGILAAGVLGLSTDRSAAHLSILVGAALLVALATVLLYSAGPLAV